VGLHLERELAPGVQPCHGGTWTPLGVGEVHLGVRDAARGVGRRECTRRRGASGAKLRERQIWLAKPEEPRVWQRGQALDLTVAWSGGVDGPTGAS